jgi:membrane-associated protease RseP (regulator of RpoE activity)
LSKIQLVIKSASYEQLGNPLLFKILQSILIGKIPQGFDLVLHPFAYAGWVGLFVTALNLLPVGQLDGGHVLYAVFGDRSRTIFRVIIAMLLLLAVFYNPGWLLISILLLIFGRHHPPPFDTETGLDNTRKIIALVVFIILVLSFIPAPFPEFNSPNIFNMFRRGGIFR